MQFPESTIVIIDPEEKPVLWVEIDEWGEIDRMESCRIEEELENRFGIFISDFDTYYTHSNGFRILIMQA